MLRGAAPFEKCYGPVVSSMLYVVSKSDTCAVATVSGQSTLKSGHNHGRCGHAGGTASDCVEGNILVLYLSQLCIIPLLQNCITVILAMPVMCEHAIAACFAKIHILHTYCILLRM